MKRLMLILCLLHASHALAVLEENLLKLWPTTVMSFYQSLSDHSFHNTQGMRLSYRAYLQDKNKKSLVLIPGQSEAAQEYAELIYDLRNSGYNIFVLDHQGQGESDRHLSDTHKSHVLYFEDYVRDLNQWMSQEVIPQIQGQKIYLLAHSMGAAISAHYLATYPHSITKAAFIAPMMEINTKPYSEPVARMFAKFLRKIGKSTHYAPGKGPYIPELDLFETNTLTKSKARHTVSKMIFTNWPHLTVAGPTVQWVDQSLKATRSIDLLAKKINTPILLLQAGKDKIVKPNRQKKFCDNSMACKLIVFENAEHEILMERDFIRDEALERILSFY